MGQTRAANRDAPQLGPLLELDAGSRHNVALLADRRLFAWGWNDRGQTNIPTGLTNIVSLAFGDEVTLALISDTLPPQVAQAINLTRTSTGFSLQIPSRSGRVYRLEYTTSLANPVWTPLPLVAGNGGLLTLTDPAAADHSRFYRVRCW